MIRLTAFTDGAVGVPFINGPIQTRVVSYTSIKGAISCKFGLTLVLILQISIKIFGLTEPQMSIKICHSPNYFAVFGKLSPVSRTHL